MWGTICCCELTHTTVWLGGASGSAVHLRCIPIPSLSLLQRIRVSVSRDTAHPINDQLGCTRLATLCRGGTNWVGGPPLTPLVFDKGNALVSRKARRRARARARACARASEGRFPLLICKPPRAPSKGRNNELLWKVVALRRLQGWHHYGEDDMASLLAMADILVVNYALHYTDNDVRRALYASIPVVLPSVLFPETQRLQLSFVPCLLR